MYGKRLAYIAKVRNIRRIPGADNIELATVLDYTVVIKKGEFRAGDLGLYVEAGSILPDGLSEQDRATYKAVKDGAVAKGIPLTDEEVALTLSGLTSKSKYPFFEFLRPKHFRIRNMKLSKFGVVSQGILFAPAVVGLSDVKEGQDYTEHFEVREPVEDPVEAGVSKERKPGPWRTAFGVLERHVLDKFAWYRNWKRVHRVSETWGGSFPAKSDEENVQHVYSEMYEKYKGKEWIVTEKLEGQNISIYTEQVPGLIHGSRKRVGVCSRNRELSPRNEDKSAKAFWDTVRRLGLDRKILDIPGEWWCRGEHLGPGIQNNIYKLEETDVVFFDFYHREQGETGPAWVKLGFQESVEFAKEHGLKFVPVLDEHYRLPDGGMNDKGIELSGADIMLRQSDGKTVFGNDRKHKREGFVLRLKDDYSVSFKVKNPEYTYKS